MPKTSEADCEYRSQTKMTNSDLFTLLIECADELQEYRNSPLDMSNRVYDRLKALELKAREAARGD